MNGLGKKFFYDEEKTLEGQFIMDNYAGDEIRYKHYKYKGEINNNKANGLGQLYLKEGWIYEGTFLNDEIFEN